MCCLFVGMTRMPTKVAPLNSTLPSESFRPFSFFPIFSGVSFSRYETTAGLSWLSCSPMLAGVLALPVRAAMRTRAMARKERAVDMGLSWLEVFEVRQKNTQADAEPDADREERECSAKEKGQRGIERGVHRPGV